MLAWLKREASVVREAVRTGQSPDSVRSARAAIQSDAWKLGASYADVACLAACEAEVTTLSTKYGTLHLRPRNSDWLVLKQVFIDGEYDFDATPQMGRIRTAYVEMLAEGVTPVIIDAGANIGAASLLFHDRFPEAKIIAVEPDPDNVALARQNIAGHAEIELKAAAIGGSAGVVAIGGPKEGGWGAQTIRANTGIPVVTVNALAAEVSNGRLLIVKIDIEGFESDLFSANTEWAHEAVAVIIEPHDWLFPGRGTSQALQREMMAQGRELIISGENLVFV